MFNRLYILLAAVLLLCGVFLVSCESEELDHEHIFAESEVPATCTENGKKERTCKICNRTELIEVLPAKGHDPHGWQVKVEPTCTVNKVEEKRCKVCNAVVDSKAYAVTGHQFGEMQIIQSATCAEMGLMGQFCTVCGEAGPTKLIEMKQHNYTTIEVGSTCVLGAHIRYTCTACGDSYGAEYATPMDNHVESENWVVEVAPTCSSDGVRKKICSVCATDLYYESIPMSTDNHSFKVETFPPTETEEGYVRYTCKNCGLEKTSIYETNYLPSQIYEMIVSATVRIEAYNQNGMLNNVGSGFFINDKGEILTNFHVIAGASQLKVKLYGGDVYEVLAVKGYDIANDLAVLKIEREGTTFLRIATAGVSAGDAVYTLGSPLGVDNVFTSGIVSNPNRPVSGIDCIVFTAPISQGSSGGPLVNSRGEVIGINNRVADNAQNLNFAINIAVLEGLDMSLEMTVEEVYTETLSSNAFIILKRYISKNYDKINVDGKYIIERVLREEDAKNGAYGWKYQMEYDDISGAIILRFVWIQSGMDLYRAEIYITGVDDSYTVRFFDCIWSQYTMYGTVNALIQPIKMENGRLELTLISKIFNFSYISYNQQATSNTIAQDTARELFGFAYIEIIEQTKGILENSETQVTIDHFNFQEVVEKKTESPTE